MAALSPASDVTDVRTNHSKSIKMKKSKTTSVSKKIDFNCPEGTWEATCNRIFIVKGCQQLRMQFVAETSEGKKAVGRSFWFQKNGAGAIKLTPGSDLYRFLGLWLGEEPENLGLLWDYKKLKGRTASVTVKHGLYDKSRYPKPYVVLHSIAPAAPASETDLAA